MMLITFAYSAYYPYFQTSAKMLQVKYAIESEAASKLYALPYELVAVICPILGLHIDKHGKRI